MKHVTLSSSESKPVFVGIDVHLRSYSVVVLRDELKPLRVSMPAEPEALVGFLQSRFEGAPIYSAYEAGFSGFVLHRFLIKRGIHNIVVNPSAVPVSSWDRVKTDKRDAMKLATLLRSQTLRGIAIPSEFEERERILSRTRAEIVKDQSRVGIRVKSKLRQFGFLRAEEDRPITAKFLKQLLNSELPLELKEAIRGASKIWETMNRERRRLEKLIAQRVSKEKRAAVYRTVPGVGAISSAVLLYELGNLNRFRNVRALYSYTGLTPAEYSSGPHIRKGHITRQGNARIRGTLVEVAWRAIRKDPSLRSIYEKIKYRRGAKRAIVAVARHLVGRIRACALNQTDYRLAA